MKKEEKIKARQLRKAGFSISEIKTKLGVAKSSVSLWVRDIKLNKNQLKKISQHGGSRLVVERRRITRLNRETQRRQLVIEKAKGQIKKLNLRELWLVGVMLYWAEGGKTQRGLVRFTNSDPEMIKIMMTFFRKICLVPEEKFRCHLHIHSHLDDKKAKKYWSKMTGVKMQKFFKTYRKPNIASKNKKDNLPMGTLDIYICDTILFLKIKGWAQGIFAAY